METIEINIYYGNRIETTCDIPDEQIFSPCIASKYWFVNEIGLDEDV